MAFIRGRSLSNVIFIVDEAQNLTPHEVKTIITRAGENTKIIFTGDVSIICKGGVALRSGDGESLEGVDGARWGVDGARTGVKGVNGARGRSGEAGAAVEESSGGRVTEACRDLRELLSPAGREGRSSAPIGGGEAEAADELGGRGGRGTAATCRS